MAAGNRGHCAGGTPVGGQSGRGWGAKGKGRARHHCWGLRAVGWSTRHTLLHDPLTRCAVPQAALHRACGGQLCVKGLHHPAFSVLGLVLLWGRGDVPLRVCFCATGTSGLLLATAWAWMPQGKGPRRRPQRRLDRRLEEVAKAVGVGYCRLRMPLKLRLGVRETVAGHRLGALERPPHPPLPTHPCCRA